MVHRIDEQAARDQSLAHLAEFCDRYLTGTVRRIIGWKRLSSRALPEMCDEARQELAVDCLQNCWQLATQPKTLLHARWMRLVERLIYRLWVAAQPWQPLPSDLEARPEWCLTGGTVPVPVPELEALRNGRPNVTGSARRGGITPRSLRAQLDSIAQRLGHGNSHHAFWCARLAEAMTGLAADLLRDQERVHLLPRPRRSPDPRGRLRRIRRMVGRFHIRPTTLRERSILRRWLGKPHLDANAPRRLLHQAVQLAPFDRAPWLWLFEACLADGDLAAAASALRQCRLRCAPSAAASTLARARLLEARGRLDRAIALVLRAAQRWPRDPTLAALAPQLSRPEATAVPAGCGGDVP